MSDVWQLETPSELDACDLMSCLYEEARQGKTASRNIIKRCYDDSWKTIKERMEAEGSIWYVWFMDGVRNLMVSMV